MVVLIGSSTFQGGACRTDGVHGLEEDDVGDAFAVAEGVGRVEPREARAQDGHRGHWSGGGGGRMRLLARPSGGGVSW